MMTGGRDIRAEAAPFEAIVLAAGAGTRFGGGKLLAPWGTGLLLEGALSAAFAAPVAAVTLAWGADERVAAAAKAFAAERGAAARLRLVHAVRYAEGLSASLIATVRALPADAPGAYVFLGDMPRIPRAVLDPLAQAVRRGAQAAAPVFEGRRGHPVLFGRGLLPKLLTLRGDRGAGGLVQGLGAQLALVPAPDDGVLFDVDRLQDLADQDAPKRLPLGPASS